MRAVRKAGSGLEKQFSEVELDVSRQAPRTAPSVPLNRLGHGIRGKGIRAGEGGIFQRSHPAQSLGGSFSHPRAEGRLVKDHPHETHKLSELFGELLV